jgi:hypothetical protein
MQLIDFIITVFCKIDDMLKKILQSGRLRQRGPQPKLSDSEVIAMEVIGEFLGQDTDEEIHSYFRTHWSNLFPSIPDRSVFVRQSANLWAVKEKLRQQYLATLIDPKDKLRIIDGFPLPVCNFRRAYFAKAFKGSAAYGFCASKNLTYYGLKGHLLVDACGVIVDMTVTAANIDEREAFFDLVHHIPAKVLGDKGYILRETRKQDLHDMGIQLETPLRDNMKETRPAPYLRWLGKTRRIIETVIGQLSERLHIEKIRARDLWHLTNRIGRKLLSHTVAHVIARAQGIPGLRFDDLITV